MSFQASPYKDFFGTIKVSMPCSTTNWSKHIFENSSALSPLEKTIFYSFLKKSFSFLFKTVLKP